MRTMAPKKLNVYSQSDTTGLQRRKNDFVFCPFRTLPPLSARRLARNNAYLFCTARHLLEIWLGRKQSENAKTHKYSPGLSAHDTFFSGGEMQRRMCSRGNVFVYKMTRRKKL